MRKPSIFDVEDENTPLPVTPKKTQANKKPTIFDIQEEEAVPTKEPTIRRSDYTGPRAGSLPAALGMGDKENPQYNEAPIVPVTKAATRGAGKLYGQAVGEAQKLQNLFGFPELHEGTPKENEEAIVAQLPYESTDPLLRGFERGTELSLLGAPFKLPGILGGLVSGAAGRASKEISEPFVGEKASDWIQTGTELGIVPALMIKELYPKAVSFIKSFTSQGKANNIAKTLNLDEMSPGEFKLFGEEIVPEIRKNYQAEHNIRKQMETDKFQREHNQKIANVKAKHLNEWQEKEALDALNAEYEAKVQEIDQRFAAEQTQFDQEMAAFDQYNARNEAVGNSLGIQGEATGSLQGRVTRQQDTRGRSFNAGDTGIRPTPAPEAPATFTDRILNRISEGQIQNKTHMGETLNGIIESSANFDNRAVSRLYQQSREANTGIGGLQQQLINHLQNRMAEFNRLEHLNPMQQRFVDVANDLLNLLAHRTPQGHITGLRHVDNQVLLDQAQAIRYYMDYEFANANPSGIFRPTLQAIDQAVETTAAEHMASEGIASNRADPVATNRAARDAYAEWTDLYNTPYVNPYRSSTNHDYIKLFNDALDIDNFRQIQRVLNRTNYGAEAGNVTRRALVEKYLKPYLENPLGTSIQDFDRALAELAPILPEGMGPEIRAEYMAERRSNIRTSRHNVPERPTKPTKEPLPNKPKPRKEIKGVEIPARSKFQESKELEAISKKLKITTDEAMKMTDSVQGLRDLKTDLSRSTAGKKLLERAYQYKLRDILFEGKVINRPTGEQMFKQANKPENFAILTEIMGEKEATRLLVELDKIGEKTMTRTVIEHVVKDAAVIKMLRLVGLLG